MTIDPAKFKLVSLAEVSNEQWNTWAQQLPGSTPQHSAEFLHYLDAFSPETKGHGQSFVVIDSSQQLIGLCPFSIHRLEVNGRQITETSFSGAALPYPSLAMASTNERRRIARDVFGLLEHRASTFNAERIVLRKSAVTLRTITDPRPIYDLEAIENGYMALPEPSYYVDLRRTEDELFMQMTGEHRKRIRQTMRKGLSVQSCWRGSSDATMTETFLKQRFGEYRHAHFLSAGRQTRPEKTWQLMLDYLLKGQASLHVTLLENRAISFLYCGEFEKLAMGWSQANLEEFERDYSPRHILEWEAIRNYRQRGFVFYNIGPRYKYPQLHHVPSAKEITIGNFKERYGAEPWPDYVLEKYMDAALCETVFQTRFKTFQEGQEMIHRQAAVQETDPL